MDELLRIENRAGLSDDDFAALANELQSHRSIKTVLDWALTRGLALSSIDVLAQDEFSHDVQLQLSDKRWLVYDCS